MANKEKEEIKIRDEDRVYINVNLTRFSSDGHSWNGRAYINPFKLEHDIVI